jgi:hypothetical protein
VKTPQTAAIVALTATTLVSGTVAWQQYQRAEKLEAAATTASAHVSSPAASASTTDEPTLAAAPAAVTPAAADEPAAEAATAIEPADAPRPRGRGDPGARLNQLMENPQFAAAWQAQQKARLDDRYAALFRRLNLNPTQLEQLKTLLAERLSSRMDVMSAARSEGLTGRENRDELRALVQQAEAEINSGIRALLGENGYTQLQQYERTAPQRSLVNQLETRLSYSTTPLTSTQTEALVNILAEAGGSAPGRNPPAEMNTMVAFGPGGSAMSFNPGGTTITDAVIARAQGVLTPSQVDALKQLQAEQQSQRQINEMMRRQFQSNRPTGPTAGGG